MSIEAVIIKKETMGSKWGRKEILLPSNDVLQTDAYAGKMWMMGGQGNKLSRSDGIDMSLGLITTPNDLKNLKLNSNFNANSETVKRERGIYLKIIKINICMA